MDRTTNVYLIYSFRQEWTPPLYWAFGSITKPRSAGFSIHPAAAQSIYRVSSTLNSWAQRTTFDRMEKCSLLRGGLVDSWVPQSNTPEPPSFFSWSEHSGQFCMSWVFLERLQAFRSMECRGSWYRQPSRAGKTNKNSKIVAKDYIESLVNWEGSFSRRSIQVPKCS